ncbi:hypothetical protein K8R03_04400 [Candidatus Kaiserbacteria bacterium]|nr:hypothetical protein [Candidatus Kaiserbacteria bacterium]
MRVFHHIPLTPLNILASCSIIGLLAVVGFKVSAPLRAHAPVTATASTTAPQIPGAATSPSWQQEMTLLGLATSSGPVAGDEDPVGMIAPQVLAQLVGEYQGLQQSGTFNKDSASAAAERIAPNVKATVPYTPYTPEDISTDSDSSYARMLTYRNDMRTALTPLLDNTRAEYEIYADFVATGDAAYLRELHKAAKNYSDAAAAAAHITVPADIAQTHLDTVNALVHFSATLLSMTVHADDPIASVALMRTYNTSELAVVDSFDRLAKYQRMKQP